MNIITEALRALNRIDEAENQEKVAAEVAEKEAQEKKEEVKPIPQPAEANKKVEKTVDDEHPNAILQDLWDQVYCSLTDAGVNATYKVLGKMNGKNKYQVDEVTSDEDDNVSIIIVKANDLTEAEKVAKTYNLPYRKTNDGRLKIRIKKPIPAINYDLIDPSYRAEVKDSLGIIPTDDDLREASKNPKANIAPINAALKEEDWEGALENAKDDLAAAEDKKSVLAEVARNIIRDRFPDIVDELFDAAMGLCLSRLTKLAARKGLTNYN